MPVDRVALDRRLPIISNLLASHGGDIEIDEVSAAGVVRVKFKGFCTACTLRPFTLERVVRPLLTAVEGVTAVEAVGVRISEESQRRLEASLR